MDVVNSGFSGNISNSDVDVLIVGAGPVGLWMADQIKIQSPKIGVKLLDKYSAYTRNQTLKVYKNSFRGIPKHAGLAALCNSWVEEKFVPIKEIQGGLKGIAEEFGMGFDVLNVEEPIQLKELYPNVRVIVGCDGAHSIVRKKIFNDEFYVNTPLQYTVRVSYKVNAEAKKSGLIKSSAVGTITGTFVDDRVGKVKDNSREVSATFVVDEAVFNLVAEAKAKEPWEITDERVPETLREQILNWMAARQAAGLEERREEAPPKVDLTAIQLSIYRSKDIAKVDEMNPRLTYLLAGDSFSGLPYLRSLAKGLQEGTRLAKCIVSVLNSATAPEGTLHPLFEEYFKYAVKLFKSEAKLAKSKAFGLKTVRLGFKLSRICTPQVGLRMFARVTLKLQPQDWDSAGGPFPKHPVDKFLDVCKECTGELEATHELSEESIDEVVL